MAKPVLSLAAAWASFEQQVMPDGAPATQRRDWRRVFYAGAQSFMDTLMQGLDPGDEPTDADMDRMDGLAHELAQFSRAAQQGKA